MDSMQNHKPADHAQNQYPGFQVIGRYLSSANLGGIGQKSPGGRPKHAWRRMAEKERNRFGWRSWNRAKQLARKRQKWNWKLRSHHMRPLRLARRMAMTTSALRRERLNSDVNPNPFRIIKRIDFHSLYYKMKIKRSQSIPYFRPKWLKTIPFGSTDTDISNIKNTPSSFPTREPITGWY